MRGKQKEKSLTYPHTQFRPIFQMVGTSEQKVFELLHRGQAELRTTCDT